MTIEATLLALLREQRETNDLLRRLLADRAQAHPFGYPSVLAPLGPSRTGDPVNPCVTTARPNFESPLTVGDAGAIRLGWPEQTPPCASACGMVGP